MSYSHRFSRLFQAEKIQPPRNFVPVDVPANTQLYVEIGAGKGKHAMSFCQMQPQAHLVAIERTSGKYAAFAKKLSMLNQQKPLANLTAIHADAIAWCVHALPAQCLAGVFILYPNPEPNNPNQRWLNMPFFEFLLSRMLPEAQLVLATNIKSYAEESYAQAKNVWQLTAQLNTVPADSQRTHFEKKYLQRGESCWELLLTKPKGYVTRFDDWQKID